MQGGAATLTKTALINIYYDNELRELGAYLINTVHDEILVEAGEVLSLGDISIESIIVVENGVKVRYIGIN